MVSIREPTPPDQQSKLPPTEATGIRDDKSASGCQIPLTDAAKRPRPDTPETMPDDPERPAKARKVVQEGHNGASKGTRHLWPQGRNDEDSDVADGHSGVPTWESDLLALSPIVMTSAWTDPAPPVSPFFSTAGKINKNAAVAERWVYGYQHNKLQIAAWAPTDTWVKIIRQCDNMSIWMLRNSCRDMMKLCEASVPSLRGRRGRARPDYRIGRSKNPWSGLEKHRDEMKAQLNKQQFCQPCQEHRREWPTETALGDYPSSKLDRLDRTDIGMSADAPICRHLQLSFDKLEDWWDEMPQNPRRVACQHQTHRKYCEPAGRPSITVRSHSDVAGEKGITVADVEWEAAIITLPCDGNGDPLKQLSYTSLRDLIWAEASKADRGLPRLLCPHLSWKDHSLLRPFDPTVCSCMDTANVLMYEAQERHDPAYCVFHRKDINCCICQMAKSDKAGIFLPEDQVGGQYVAHVGCCTDCLTWYTWARRLDAKTKSWRLWLKMKYRVDTGDETSNSWLHRINPESIAHNFRRSKRLKHRSWCDDGGCATSYRDRKNARLLGIE